MSGARQAAPPLPKLHRELLDEAGVDALFAAVAREGEAVRILLKGDVSAYANDDVVTLSAARELLRARTVHAVQLRYRRGTTAWLDTLLCGPDGVRLVRIESTSDA